MPAQGERSEYTSLCVREELVSLCIPPEYATVVETHTVCGRGFLEFVGNSSRSMQVEVNLSQVVLRCCFGVAPFFPLLLLLV